MIDLTSGEILILALGSLGLGMYLLFKGGDWTIDAAVYLAKHLGISPLVIGFTIVAFGTSLPELIVSINANLAGSSGIAIGNVVGSNIANILMVVGATALFATLTVQPREIMRDVAMMVLTTVIMIGVLSTGEITRFAGFAMILFLGGYVFWQYTMAKKGEIIPDEINEPVFNHPLRALFFLVLGLGCIALGAEFLVRGAIVSASILGVPEAVIGLSVIAIGTSLPELSTCIIAAMKKHSDIVIGNILGSNVFNILMILGVASVMKPISLDSTSDQIVNLDMWVALGVAILFSLHLLIFKKIPKIAGILYVTVYVFYIGTIYALYLNGESLKALAG